MTSTAVAQQQTALETLVTGLRSEKFQQQVALALPNNYPPERFARIAITAFQSSPDVALCDHNTIVIALLRCAADGLLPDGREAAIIKRGTTAAYQPMIGGVRKVVAEFGWTIVTRAVRANDTFEYTSEPPTLLHREVKPGEERGELVAAYAVATHRDGRRIQKVLHPDEIAKRRSMATTQNVWNKWDDQMWEKSAGHDIYDEIPLAEADRERLNRILYASEIDPAEATRQMFGGSAPAALPPAGAGPAPAEPTQAPSLTDTGAESQQADAGAAGSAPVSAPGQGDTGAAADDPEAGKDGYNPPEGKPDALALAVAREAAQMVPPTGVHADAGRTLEQIHALGAEGARWFGMALRKDDLPEVFKQALDAFCQMYVPDVWEAVQAERGTEL